MAEVDTSKMPSLAKDYLLEEKEEKKAVTAEKPVEDTEVKGSVEAAAAEETPTEVAPPASEEDGGENKGPSPVDEEASDNATPPPTEDTNAESDNSADQEAEETPEIKLETAPADFRFPTTNQTRHCFTRYVEFHRCIAAKGEGAPECDKFAKYYRALCPGEWVDKWNEQRENGTFAGPL